MEALLRQVVIASISDSGKHLKHWIGVLDELAETRTLASAQPLDMPSVLRFVSEQSIELALSVTAAYARYFNALVNYAIATGVPGCPQAELQAVAKYKDLITDARGVFTQMCADYRARNLPHAGDLQ